MVRNLSTPVFTRSRRDLFPVSGSARCLGVHKCWARSFLFSCATFAGALKVCLSEQAFPEIDGSRDNLKDIHGNLWCVDVPRCAVVRSFQHLLSTIFLPSFLPCVLLRRFWLLARLEDEKGLDEKVLAVPDKDPRFNHMKSLRDVPEHVLREITNFFEVQKYLVSFRF